MESLAGLTGLQVDSGVGRVVVSASQSQEEGVAALCAVHRIIFIIEVQDIFLCFETKFLIKQHGRITGRHVQRHIFPHTRLKNSTTHSVRPVAHLNRASHTYASLFHVCVTGSLDFCHFLTITSTKHKTDVTTTTFQSYNGVCVLKTCKVSH